jgi:hypothetical protein
MNDCSFATLDPGVFLLLSSEHAASLTLYELFEKTQVSITRCPQAWWSRSTIHAQFGKVIFRKKV